MQRGFGVLTCSGVNFVVMLCCLTGITMAPLWPPLDVVVGPYGRVVAVPRVGTGGGTRYPVAQHVRLESCQLASLNWVGGRIKAFAYNEGEGLGDVS